MNLICFGTERLFIRKKFHTMHIFGDTFDGACVEKNRFIIMWNESKIQGRYLLSKYFLMDHVM